MANYDYINHEGKLDELYIKMLKVFDLCNDSLSKEICCQTIEKWFIDEETDIVHNGEAYFFTHEIMLSSQECLVDAGAFDGDTIQSFRKATNDHYKKIYAFEMDRRNFYNLKKNCLKFDDIHNRIELYPIGLSAQRGSFYYNGNFKSTQFEEKGNEVCEVDYLDNIFQDKEVTFIKMDIEGSEMKALHGAEKLISKQNPRLAICIYHSVEDFLNILVYLKKLNPEYKIMIRHHSDCDAKIVCYAY